MKVKEDVKVIAVIPCYNEQDFIASVVRTSKRFVDEVIVSDDASTDNTIDTAILAGGYVVEAPNGAKRGAGACTRRGIEKALDEGADIIVTLDGDGQHDPNDILALVVPIAEGKADMVIGSRFLNGGYKIKRYRKLGIDAITRVLNFGANAKIVDGQSCFRAFSRDVLERMEITETGFSFSVEMPAKVRAMGFRIAEVPTRCIYHDRHGSNSTMNPVRHGIPVLLKAAKWKLWETLAKRKDSIVIWASFLQPHVGGYEKNVMELARRLTARGYKIDIITCMTDKGGAKQEKVDGVNITRLPSLRLLRGTYLIPLPSIALLKLLLLHRYHSVAITQTRFFPLSFVGAMHATLHRVPLIHVERGSRHSSLSDPLVDKISRAYDHTIGRWVLSQAKRVVGVSNAACEFARHLGAREVTRIPNGIDAVGLADKVQTGEPVILFVGRMVYAKGVQDLITATGCFERNHRLALVGDGPYREQLQEFADGSRVHFHGELTGERLWSVYREADIFVNPSYSEGLPTSVMEAAACGVPIVATAVGGTEEIIQDKVTGLLVQPNDVDGLAQAMCWVLDNREEAKSMATACREKVLREYSWEKITDQYCTVIESLSRQGGQG